MSEQRKPLPDHTCLDYWECYAKITLEWLFPNTYNNLAIKDKPDLQTGDGSIGIEVTQAIDSDQRKAENLYVKKVTGTIRDGEKAMKEIEKANCKLEGGILRGKPCEDSFDLVFEALKSKLKKLNNGGYKEFENNDLFIFSIIYADDKMLSNALISLRQIQAVYEKSYRNIFVLSCEYLYVFDVMHGFKVINISSEEQYRIAVHSRDMAAGMKEKQYSYDLKNVKRASAKR